MRADSLPASCAAAARAAWAARAPAVFWDALAWRGSAAAAAGTYRRASPRAPAAAQVRSDCPPQRLLEFLVGAAGAAADEAAAAIAASKAEEDALLEQARALGATALSW
jgi:hypothetical protein